MSRARLATFVFDLGNVLINWNPRNLYRKLFVEDEAGMEAFLQDVCSQEWNERQDAGRSFDEGVRELVDRFPDQEPLIRAFRDRWTETLGGVIDGTVEILGELEARNHPLHALSNWNADTFRLVRERYAFLDLFDNIVISGQERILKPDPRIFEIVLARANRAARECIFVDDSAVNVAAAARIGFDGIVFTTPDALRAELLRRGITLGD